MDLTVVADELAKIPKLYENNLEGVHGADPVHIVFYVCYSLV